MKKHTEDFKRETVRIALTSGLSRERVAAAPNRCRFLLPKIAVAA